MRNKKKICGIVVAVFLVLVLGSLYMYWDYQNVIQVGTEYKYSEESFFVVNTYGKNNSLWSRIRQDDSIYEGAGISAVDTNGNVCNLIQMKDAIIADAYHLDNHLYVLYYHISDYNRELGTGNVYRLAEFDLDHLSDYTVTEYVPGEIIGMNEENAKPVKRSDIRIAHELRSNPVQVDGTFYYLDGNHLVAFSGEQYDQVYTFDEKLNGGEIFQTENFLYAVLNDGYDKFMVYVLDLQNLSTNLCYETAKEIVDLDIMDDALYILFEQSLISVKNDGAVMDIFSLDSENEEVFRGLDHNENNFILFSSQGIIEIDTVGKVLKEASYNDNIAIEMKVK